MIDDVMREPFTSFQETHDKVRNNDMGATDPYRFVKRVSCGHESHPSNTNPTVLNPLWCGTDITKSEIPGLWQT
jgi:hypothetical protein